MAQLLVCIRPYFSQQEPIHSLSLTNTSTPPSSLAPPNLHIRAILNWGQIFPLVKNAKLWKWELMTRYHSMKCVLLLNEKPGAVDSFSWSLHFARIHLDSFSSHGLKWTMWDCGRLQEQHTHRTKIQHKQKKNTHNTKRQADNGNRALCIVLVILILICAFYYYYTYKTLLYIYICAGCCQRLCY